MKIMAFVGENDVFNVKEDIDKLKKVMPEDA